MTDVTVVDVTQGLRIQIEETSGRTVTVQAEPSIELQVSTTGLQGPPGPQGPAGAAGGDIFVYDRHGVAASQWVIDHNLGRLAHITVVLDSGEEVTTDVDQHSINTCTITFAAPTAGKALVG